MLWEIFPAFGESVESSNSSEWHWMRNLLRNSMCLLRMKSRPLLQNDTEWEILWEICPVFIHRIVHFFRMTLYEKCFEKYSLYWEWRVVHFFRMTLDEKFFEKYSLCLLRMKFTSSDSEWHNKKCFEKINILCVYWEWRVVLFFTMTLNEKCFEKYALCLLKSRSLLQNEKCFEKYALCLFRMKSRSLFQNDTDEKWFEKYSLRLLRMNSHSLLQNDTEWEMFWEIFSVFIESEEPFTSLEWHWMRNVLSNILCVYWEWRYVHFFRITLNEKSFEKYSLFIESEEPFTFSE